MALYQGIFIHKHFKRLNRLLGILLVTHGIEESIVLILQCRPMYKAWSPAVPGYCVNLKVYYYASVGGPIIILSGSS